MFACLLMAGLLAKHPAISQSIPVEVFAGDKKATLDILFFKFFKKTDNTNSRFLFFNRNRASIDYQMNETTNLPQFGFTEAISYNTPKLNGFAPVAVIQILNRGVYPKLGIQYALQKTNFTFFGWVVMETLNNPNVDFFVLARFTPPFNQNLNLFSQVELLNSFPTVTKNNFSFTQRIRLGLKVNIFQFGLGADFSENGRIEFVNTSNIGGFVRYEF